MIRLTSLCCLLAALYSSTLSAATSGTASYFIPEVRLDVTDIESIKRGATTFFGTCAACHSLKFMRYQRIADDLSLTEAQMRELGYLPKNKKLLDSVLTSLDPKGAVTAYGIVPPDLSLKTRSRGTAWIHAFLTNYYQDADSATGFNNAVFPGTAMPNLLIGKQGILEPVYVSNSDGEKELTGLRQKSPGASSAKSFYNEMRDLVIFLDYVSEPSKLERYALAPWVLLFLFGLLILVYLLKREYWKDVH